VRLNKKTFISFIFSLSIQPVFAIGPILIDAAVVGSAQSPLIEPQQFQFEVGQEYLLVIDNDSSDSIAFNFGTFGQKVFTMSVFGTSSMSQDAMVINGHSKLQWQFRPQEAGEYTYYASNTSLNKRGSDGKIVVKKLEVANPMVSAESETDLTINTEVKTAKQKQRGLRD
jgi:hypothetical protein